MTERDDIDTVIRANKELSTVLARVETCLAKVREGFSSISLAQSEAAKTSNELGAQLADTGEIATENTEKSRSAAEKEAEALKTRITLTGALGEAVSFLSQTEDNYKKAQDNLWKEFYGEEGFSKKHAAEFTAMMGINELYKASVSSLGAVHSSVYSAMEGQLMSFIETGRFSAAAFVQVVARQVKTELVGLAAKSAVWAIYEVAMGLKDMATPGMQASAALHFASAKQFALVGGASLAAAAGVQSAFFGGVENSRSGATGVGTAGIQRLSAFSTGSGSNLQTLQTRNITINIQNGMGDAAYWAKLVEDNIVPALNDAANRNVNLVVKYA